jgi:hypothetical protein
MSQPALHGIEKIIADAPVSALARAQPGGLFSVFGSANTVLSTGQLKQPRVVTLLDQGVAVPQIFAEPKLVAVGLLQASISLREQDNRSMAARRMPQTWLLEANENGRERVKGRRTGPVQVLSKIANDWQLSDAELAALLAYPNAQDAADLLDGRLSLRNPDREDRVRLLYRIYQVLSSLLPDASRQQAWLRGTNPNLRNKSPLEFMMERRIPGMVSVQNLVERLAGR